MSSQSQQSGQGPSAGLPPGMPPGPPYPPMTASVGGQPTVSVDVPICAVFIALFIGGAVGHMVTFQKNNRRAHKFIPSVVTFGFCMARITASSLRIALATEPTNVDLAIAAQVLVAAGVLLLFILNLLFVLRILRASHPKLGWSRAVSFSFKALYIIIFLSLVILITASVQMLFTLDPNVRLIDRNLQLYGASLFTFVGFLPLPILAYALIISPGQPTEQFGGGSWKAKAFIVGVSAALLTLGAGFRLGTSAMPARPTMDPAWYHHKACFYVFNFGIEVVVAYLWLFGRIDRRFHVPNGSSKVRTYSGGEKPAEDSNTDTPMAIGDSQRKQDTSAV